MIEAVLIEDQKSSEVGSNCSSGKTTGFQKTKQAVEILREGQECPFCHFTKMKREGNEIVCPICGYGYRVCT